MTEASPLLTQMPRFLNRQTLYEKAESIGKPVLYVEIAIDSGAGPETEPYKRGEILARGPNIMLGYLHNEHDTQSVLYNGYLHTGDIGYLDEDGFVYIVGRKKKIVITQGYNVQPEEIEDCLKGSGMVKECYVYGVDDAMQGEALCADVLPGNSAIEVYDLRAYLKTHLVFYKVPTRIRLVDSLDMTISGKVKRR